MNTQPWSKTLQKDTIQLSYISFHYFCDMSLITTVVQFSAV